MTRKTFTIRLLAVLLALGLVVSFSGCSKKKSYDVTKEEMAEFFWENCFSETLEGVLTSYNATFMSSYLWFYCYLPEDKEFEQVESLLEEIKNNVLEVCSDLSFEPFNTFLVDTHYTVHLELINPRDSYPNDYLRKAGEIVFNLEDFPVNDKATDDIIHYY